MKIPLCTGQFLQNLLLVPAFEYYAELADRYSWVRHHNKRMKDKTISLSTEKARQDLVWFVKNVPDEVLLSLTDRRF